MEQRGREHNSWKELVEKAIDAKAKTSLQLPLILREIDQCCPRSNQLAHSTVTKSQTSSTWDLRNNPVKKLLPFLTLKLSNSLPARSSEISNKKT